MDPGEESSRRGRLGGEEENLHPLGVGPPSRESNENHKLNLMGLDIVLITALS